MVSLFTPISVDDHRHPTNPKAFSTTDSQILVSKILSHVLRIGGTVVSPGPVKLPWRSYLLLTLISNMGRRLT